MTQFQNNCHPIRLRGPWEFRVLSRTRSSSGELLVVDEQLPPPGTINRPADWLHLLGFDFAGRIELTRFFNCPTGLKTGDRVDLVFGTVQAQSTVRLNGEAIGELGFSDSSLRMDITSRLLARNVINVELELPSKSLPIETARRDENDHSPSGFLDEVRLEIFAQ